MATGPFVLRERSEDVQSEYVLTREVMTAGRDGRNDIVIDAPGVSRFHAEFSQAEGRLAVRDRESENGVWVNGRRVHGPFVVHEGDMIALGERMLVVDRRPKPSARWATAGLLRSARVHTPIMPADPPAPSAETTAPGMNRELFEPACKTPHLRVVKGQGPRGAFAVTRREFVIGRHPGCDLFLRGGEISERHARIVTRRGRHYLYDADSAAGTFVNGGKIRGMTLSDGDYIRIGEITLRYTVPLGLSEPATKRNPRTWGHPNFARTLAIASTAAALAAVAAIVLTAFAV
ncbi:FHA domain-containing protein [bacterium]|nr:FHA domain-containing protein [bacterium]